MERNLKWDFKRYIFNRLGKFQSENVTCINGPALVQSFVKNFNLQRCVLNNEL